MMQFSYDGFTHKGNARCFLFRGIEERTAKTVFCIEVDLPLFAQNRVPMQEGPMFCLQLLTTALQAGPNTLDKFHSYRVVDEDFRPLLVERERVAAEKALRVTARKAVHRPPHSSNLRRTP